MNATTTLQGWQFNDPSRSSWDIIWTCLTTIFACTWTVLHQSVPAKNRSEGFIFAAKLWVWILTFLAPEMLVFTASEQFWQVRSLRERCNEAQDTRDRSVEEPASWLFNRTKTLPASVDSGNGSGSEQVDLYPEHARWTYPQVWVVYMTGLTLETLDGWWFYVSKDQILQLIQLGVVRCSDFTDREVQDRAKTDTFAKAFTVCQSTWLTANIIARAGYGLPITPFEFSALSYLVCAIMIYACWWHKPQDMTVPIVLPLRYTREDLPEEIRAVTDSRKYQWRHRRVIPNRDGTGKGFLSVGKMLQTVAVDQPAQGSMTRAYKRLSVRDETLLNTFATACGVLFCSIHVAAWTFAFPTYGEKIAWRVFSLTALGVVVSINAIAQVPLTLRWLKDNGASLPLSMQNLADVNGKYTWMEIYGPLPLILVYTLARIGLAVLTVLSMRALPSGAYIAVDWLGSIPHI
ncbi:hypothetical protein BJY04DRAFT_231286 [Aspergillus karnatakaensis]|uniref:uncharacterized protein n=1 Tax=Aspergillus karnatakaensis TaxID=1810916 RepID=UPI003CCD37C7